MTDRIRLGVALIGIIMLIIGVAWGINLYINNLSIFVIDIVPMQTAIAQTQTAFAGNVAPLQTVVAQTQVAFAQTQTAFPAEIAQTATAQAQITPIVVTPNDALLGVALTNLKFMAGGWDPRQVDVSKAATDGLFVTDNYSLRFYDLWVTVPDGITGYQGQIEAYVDGEKVGFTEKLDLTPGGTLFESIKVTGYQHPENPNTWQKQSTWKEFDLVLILYRQQEKVAAVSNQIRLDGSGEGWYFAPPYAHIVSLIYHINDGPTKSVDLRKAVEVGINISPGDRFSLDEIWAKTDENIKNQSMRVEAYLSTGSYDSTYSRRSSWMAFERGIRNISGATPLVWESVPSDRSLLILTLERDDNTVLDRFVIKLGGSQDTGLSLNPDNGQ